MPSWPPVAMGQVEEASWPRVVARVDRALVHLSRGGADAGPAECYAEHLAAQHKAAGRTLLFSTVVDLMGTVVCNVRPAIHAAFQADAESIGVSAAVTATNRCADPGTSRRRPSVQPA